MTISELMSKIEGIIEGYFGRNLIAQNMSGIYQIGNTLVKLEVENCKDYKKGSQSQ